MRTVRMTDLRKNLHTIVDTVKLGDTPSFTVINSGRPQVSIVSCRWGELATLTHELSRPEAKLPNDALVQILEQRLGQLRTATEPITLTSLLDGVVEAAKAVSDYRVLMKL